MSFCLKGSFSPAAMRICSLTRSMPVTNSVTGMLDLDAGVHLDEVEVVLLVDEELARAGVGVVGRLDQPDGRVAHRRRGSREQARAGDSSTSF